MKVFVGPGQLTTPSEYEGVTTMVAITGAVPVLTAGNAKISPEPVAGSPIPVAELVHAYVVVPPTLVVEKKMSTVFSPLHKA